MKYGLICVYLKIKLDKELSVYIYEILIRDEKYSIIEIL